MGRRNGQTPARLNQTADEWLVGPPDPDHPGSCRTLLAGVPESAPHDTRHGFVQVRIVVYDNRVFPSHLANHPFQLRLTRPHHGRLLQDFESHLPAPGKGDLSDQGMFHQGFADYLALSRKKQHHISRKTHLQHACVQTVADGAGLLGRLHQHRVTRHQSRDTHTAQNGQREIPRCDHRRRPPAAVRQFVGLTRNPGQGSGSQFAQRLPGVVAAKVDGFSHIGIRLLPGFTLFEGLQGGQFETVLLQAIGQILQQLRPFAQRATSPPRPGSHGRLHSSLRLFSGRQGDAGHQFPILTRTVSLPGFPSPTRNPDYHRHFERQPLLHLCHRPGKSGALPVVGKIGQRTVFKGRIQVPPHHVCGLHSLPTRDRFTQQRIYIPVLAVGEPQKSAVRGVFQQPSHQISHARQQFANRGVNPHPVFPGTHRLALRLSHPVEHLDFAGFFGNPRSLHLDYGVGEGAKIVAAKGRQQIVDVFQQHRGEMFVMGIGFGLVQKDRTGISVLPGVGHFVVPVRPFDQSHSAGNPPVVGQ